MRKDPTAESFLQNVSTHSMKVFLDAGLHRHLMFRAAKNSWNMWFEIITWPGRLCLSGDMGTWTFSRLEDMFQFFRSAKLEINVSYWAEKLIGGVHGGRDSSKVWDEESFREQLAAQLSDYYGFEGDKLAAVSEALKDEVLNQDTKYDLLIAARDFSFTLPDGRKFHFDPCEIPDGMEYSYHFVWCLFAIVWGIQQYDAAKKQEAS